MQMQAERSRSRVRQRETRRSTGVLVFLVLVIAMIVVVFVIPGLEEKIPLRVGHYRTQPRWYQAQQAHGIFDDPDREPCNWYTCRGSNSELKVCRGEIDGIVVWAMSWVYNDGICYKEGTCWIQKKPRKVENYIRSHGCEVQ